MVPVDREIAPRLAGKTWLVVGKGPSFDRLARTRWEGPLMLLNHAIVKTHDIGFDYDPAMAYVHAVDLEAALDVVEECDRYSRGLVMPLIPNQRMRRGSDTLTGLVHKCPEIKFMAKQGRLFYYNRAGSGGHAKAPTVPVRFFSSEGAIGVLAACGVRDIVTAGIDGGKCYSGHFDYMEPLLNGRASFDDQHDEIARTCAKFSVKLTKFSVSL